MKEPIPLTQKEAERLEWAVRAIADNHITASGIAASATLYERLFIALGLVTKQGGYEHSAPWLADLCTEEELEKALMVKRMRSGEALMEFSQLAEMISLYSLEWGSVSGCSGVCADGSCLRCRLTLISVEFEQMAEAAKTP